MSKKKKNKGINVLVPGTGYTPNYQDLIQSDPNYISYVGAQQAQANRERNARDQGIVDQLIQFGAIPPGGLPSDLLLSPDQIAALNANTASGQSTSARLQQGHNAAVQNLQDMLAARGMLRSGSLGSGLNLEQQDYTQRQSDARQKMMDIITGLVNAFATAQGQRATDRATYAGTVEQQLIDSGLYKPRDPTKAVAHRIGPGLYQDDFGNYYDAQGNVVQIPIPHLPAGANRP